MDTSYAIGGEWTHPLRQRTHAERWHGTEGRLSYHRATHGC